MRLTRELHTQPNRKERPNEWDHLTTVSPAAIEFEVEPGADWNMDIRWLQGEFSLKRPLHLAVVTRRRRGGRGDSMRALSREDWPFLCDDVEVSRDSGAISGWRARDRRKGCVDWSSLWPPPVSTTRGQVLADLRNYDFQPPVSTVGRID